MSLYNSESGKTDIRNIGVVESTLAVVWPKGFGSSPYMSDQKENIV
jgi:hypothetical protein